MGAVDDAFRRAAEKRGTKHVDLSGAVANGPEGEAPGESSSAVPEPGAGDDYMRQLLAAARRRQEHVVGVTDPPPAAEDTGSRGAPAAPLPGGAYVRPPEPENVDDKIRRIVRRQRGA